jgi:energy-coupling factor transporter ATP-binding protein EcfA2
MQDRMEQENTAKQILKNNANFVKSVSRDSESSDKEISSVRIIGLFGSNSFPKIELFPTNDNTTSMAFLYGENGVGKSTILKLIFSLLSTERNKGRRGYLAKTVFKELTVSFRNGYSISAIRSKLGKDGNYSIIVKKNRQALEFLWHAQAAENNRVGEDYNPEINKFVELLELIAPKIVLLDDYRSIQSSLDLEDLEIDLSSMAGRASYFQEGGVIRKYGIGTASISDYAGLVLENLIAKTENLLRDRAMKDTAIANVNTGQIYFDIVQSLMHSDLKNEESTDDTVVKMKNRIENIENFIEKYGKYSLIKGDFLDEIYGVLVGATTEKREDIIRVINPYLLSIEKKIEGVRLLSKQMSAYVNAINSFLNRKSMRFSLSEKTKFFNSSAEEIEVSNLSSGERHLIYLYSISLLSRDEPTLILVDEPELSLNFKWQRKLVESIMEIADSSAQFLMATHSFEIIGRYKDTANNLDLGKFD